MRPSVFLALLIALPAPALAAEPPPQRTVAITVYGNDKCPEGSGDEIIVCARLPESERYRIPKKFRKKKDESAASASWSSRVETLDQASAAARPNSCSVNGSFGQTGCTQEMLRQWFAERRQKKAAEEP